MSEKDSKDDELIACEICLKEIPRSEAQISEAEDYVAHFCGLDCFDKWKKHLEEQEQRPD